MKIMKREMDFLGREMPVKVFDELDVRKVKDIIFCDHTAEMIANTGDIFIADWKNANGSSDFAIRYMLDIKKGILTISGDVGSCIANWYHEVTSAELKTLMEDAEYFVSKIQCSSRKVYHTTCGPHDLIDIIKIDYSIYLWTIGYQMLAEQLCL